MAGGWLVRVEIEAGRGELQPFVFVVAEPDFRRAIDAARNAPDVTRPRAALNNRPPVVAGAALIHPVDAGTVAKLGLAPGQLWNVDGAPPPSGST